ncbi:MAG: GNAT family N-acetyltransferase, partial [Thermoanaerobaculia bacterium]
MQIRRATPSDAAALAAFAAETFRDTFAAQNSPEDMEAYLAKTYGEAQQRRELEQPRTAALLVFDEEKLVAFAQLRATDSQWGDVELARFYVHREHHGRGIAQALMNAVETEARALGGSVLWLGVWEHNPRAIAFYAKCGFTDAGSQPFLVGSDLQTDRVMVR